MSFINENVKQRRQCIPTSRSTHSDIPSLIRIQWRKRLKTQVKDSFRLVTIASYESAVGQCQPNGRLFTEKYIFSEETTILRRIKLCSHYSDSAEQSDHRCSASLKIENVQLIATHCNSC